MTGWTAVLVGMLLAATTFGALIFHSRDPR